MSNSEGVWFGGWLILEIGFVLDISRRAENGGFGVNVSVEVVSGGWVGVRRV
jgi:hypothetical protein